MAGFSKLVLPPLNCIPCSELLLHQGQTCTQMFWWNWYRFSVGSLRYFLPLAISPIVLKPKSLNQKKLLNILRYYLESSLWSAAACALTFSGICLLRNKLGRLYLYTTAFLPTYLAFQLAWFFPVRTVRLFSTATTQASLETWLRRHSPTITRSLPIQTLVFMISSAVILHAKRCNEFNGFWFIQPLTGLQHQKKDENYEDLKNTGSRCLHDGISCTKFIMEGMRSYLLYGIPLDLLSIVRKGRLPRRLEDLKRLQFKMTAFFLSYVGIYRLSSCALSRVTNSTNDASQHLLSAGLGGLSYIFLGKLTFSALAFVIAVQAAWQSYCYQHKDQEVKKSLLLQRFSFAKFMIPVNLAYLAHCYVFHHNELSNLAKEFFRGITDNRFQRIYQFLLSVMAENGKKQL
ncbi:transmembrane protein 135-like [Eurosta solidaginis]|uniref:transmembrane protein 135-like n=1 Tax=Eurosta solidaginis TaxID=178769 RepID=UPI003530599A